MSELNLSKYGITGATEIVHNPSYEMLFEEETKTDLEGYEKVSIQDVLLKINSSLLMKIQRTLYGGHLMNTRTITILLHRKHGLQLRILQSKNFLIRSFM